jgi:predicted phosphodiesterase
MPKYTDDSEFIDAWKRFNKASLIAKHFKMNVRSVYERRRIVEQRYGISLVSNQKSTPSSSVKNKIGDRLNELAKARQEKYELEMSDTLKDGVLMIASDAHYWPGIVTAAHKAFCKLAKQLSPKMVILNGDILDGARISRHARIMWEKQPLMKDEIAAVQDRCAEIERAAGKAKLIRTIGNHDARFENYLSSRVGEFEEMTGMTLLDYLPRWRAGWAVHLNRETEGWLTIRHRPVSGGIHASYNSTLRAGVSYVHGHLHKLQVTPWADYRGRRYGVDTGTLAEPYGPQFNYCEAGPVNWASGFAVITFVGGKMLQPELCVVEHGKAWFRGKEV